MKCNRLFSVVLGCMMSVMAFAQQNDHDFNVGKNMEMFTAVYKNLDMLYVDTLDADKVIGTGINAMLRSLDRYTEYYPADVTKGLKYQLTGSMLVSAR